MNLTIFSRGQSQPNPGQSQPIPGQVQANPGQLQPRTGIRQPRTGQRNREIGRLQPTRSLPSAFGSAILACFTLICSTLGCFTLGHFAGAQQPNPSGTQADIEFFESKIRPLLIAHCQECHSQEHKKTSGGLALDSRDGWQRGGDSGEVIVPKQPDKSLLIQAVEHASGVIAMPPEDHAAKLEPHQIADLRRWIETGAVDPRDSQSRVGGMTSEQAASWWSLQPIEHPTIPTANTSDSLAQQFNLQAADPLDLFLDAKRHEQGLAPVASASRSRWLRRITLDLTGLLPTIEELDAFESDSSELAYEKVVDRLLATPAHGERYARHWLDVARYADTAGDGADYPVREAVGYRDWAVRAFQSNMPWDQFLTEQLAGDILAEQLVSQNPASHSQSPESQSPESRLTEMRYADLVTATGFLAVGKRYGYAPNTDFQHLDFADAIDSIGRSLLGLSIGCARCHDHKYDPVTMEDYYGLYGILESTRWAFPGGEEQKRPVHFPPLVPRSIAAQKDSEKNAALAAIDTRIKDAEGRKLSLEPNYFGGGIDLDLEAQELGQAPKEAWLSAGPNQVLAEAQSPYEGLFGKGSRGVRIGAGTPFEGVRYVFKRPLKITESQPIYFAIDFRVPKSDQGSFRLYLGRGVIESIAIECGITSSSFAMKEQGKWRELHSLQPNQWYHLRLKLDLSTKSITGTLAHRAEVSEGADGNASWNALEIPAIALPQNWDGVADTFISDGFGQVDGKVLERDLDNLALELAPFSPFDAQAPERLRPESQTPEQREMREKLQREIAEELKRLQDEKNRIAAEPAYRVAYGVSEGTPTDAKVQLRGEPDKLGPVVPRRNLAILGGEKLERPESGSGRLELARWLARPDNPLVARVWVNRVWQWHFGKGLVTTPSDFGARGELPTHPELLDYLASEFVSSGWDVQRLHRSIVLSGAYRLDSDGEQDAQQRASADPSNRLMWRMSKRPLDAESLRDGMLQLSGMLDRRTPEAHPFPKVDTWGFTIHNPFYATYDTNRRSLYMMQQRNRRHPYLGLFDGADPNQSVAERFATTTPTQSLYLMNSPFVHRCAQDFAQRILEEAQGTTERIVLAYRLSTAQRPSPLEIERAEKFLKAYQESEQSDANALGESSKGWTALCRVLITSNRFLTWE